MEQTLFGDDPLWKTQGRGVSDRKKTREGQTSIAGGMAWYAVFHLLRKGHCYQAAQLSVRKAENVQDKPDPQQTFKHDVDVNLCHIPKYIQAASLPSSLLAWSLWYNSVQEIL